ncbi:MAG: archease [Acidobacteria bacterium]|nr:archease [Acidobacteriota bacterium]
MVSKPSFPLICGRYRLIDHTADVGIEVFGKSLPELFENAAFAMFHLMASLDSVSQKKAFSFSFEEESLEDLLHSWLGELLYRFSLDHLIFSHFQVEELGDNILRAKAFGERYDPTRHQLLLEIKAVTYHQLEVKKINALWGARVIFDT